MTTQLELPERPRFNGADYNHGRDSVRLTGQIRRVFGVMRDGAWRTLRELQREIQDRYFTLDPEASLSAQLRHLRKPRFGGHTIERKHLGDGLYAYRLLVVK